MPHQALKFIKNLKLKNPTPYHDSLVCNVPYTNVGDKPLIINQALASCGCTVPKYTKAPVAPGQKGQIEVTYKSDGTWPGHFKKSITVRTNGTVEMTRLYIEGVMTEVKK